MYAGSRSMARPRAKTSEDYYVLLVGVTDVGKTTFFYRLKTGYFVNTQQFSVTSAMADDVYRKTVKIDEETEVLINLVDVASHERWRLLNSNYFMKKADAVILLYSVTDIYTLYNLYEVVEDLRSYDKTSENTTWAVVGNKMDQNAEGTFFDKKVRDMMPQPELQTALAYLASAKTGENVDKIFTDVVKHMYKRKAALAPDTLYDDRAVRCPSGAKKRPGRSRGSTSNAVDYPLAFNRSSSRTVALSRTHKKHSKSSSCCV